MTYSGIDPVGLRRLGDELVERAEQISRGAADVINPLQRHGRSSAADRIGTHLTSVARGLDAYAADFGWRIDAVLRHDVTPIPGSSPFDLPFSRLHLAIALPPATSGPVELTIARHAIGILDGSSPVEVAAFFASQSQAEIALLVATHPRLMSGLDGAPPWARYAASDLLIGEQIQLLHSRARSAELELRRDDLRRFQKHLLEAHLDYVNREAAELERWLAEDRQILHFDASGDGRVIEVFGALETARNIGVVVPGITNDRWNFSDGEGGFRGNARNLHVRSVELGMQDVATIAWLGYDTPDGADAILRRAAVAGHDDLIDFVAGMDAMSGRRHIAVIGHSYGSLVTGMAAGVGLVADEVVFVGSPGTSLNHAKEAILKPGGVVWAGLAQADPIGAGVDLTEFITPQDQVRQTIEKILDSLGGEHAIKDLHHGMNPAHQDFGALEILTQGSTGHSAYFKPDTMTLDNLLYIVAGMDGRVSIEIPDEIELAPGPIGEPWTPREPTGELA